MGCCSSFDVSAPVIEIVPKNAHTTAAEIPAETAATLDKIKLEIIAPLPSSTSKENLLSTAENSDNSSHSSSLKQAVSPRPHRRSVTFNPISEVKEYHRDSSSADKEFTTYFCEELGLFDTLSDTDSADGYFDETENTEQDVQQNYDEYGENELGSPSNDWYRYEQELLRESEIDPNDPKYFQSYDLEYDPEYDTDAKYSFSHARSFHEPSCIWACS